MVIKVMANFGRGLLEGLEHGVRLAGEVSEQQRKNEEYKNKKKNEEDIMDIWRAVLPGSAVLDKSKPTGDYPQSSGQVLSPTGQPLGQMPPGALSLASAGDAGSGGSSPSPSPSLRPLYDTTNSSSGFRPWDWLKQGLPPDGGAPVSSPLPVGAGNDIAAATPQPQPQPVALQPTATPTPIAAASPVRRAINAAAPVTRPSVVSASSTLKDVGAIGDGNGIPTSIAASASPQSKFAQLVEAAKGGAGSLYDRAVDLTSRNVIQPVAEVFGGNAAQAAESPDFSGGVGGGDTSGVITPEQISADAASATTKNESAKKAINDAVTGLPQTAKSIYEYGKNKLSQANDYLTTTAKNLGGGIIASAKKMVRQRGTPSILEVNDLKTMSDISDADLNARGLTYDEIKAIRGLQAAYLPKVGFYNPTNQVQ